MPKFHRIEKSGDQQGLNRSVSNRSSSEESKSASISKSEKPAQLQAKADQRFKNSTRSVLQKKTSDPNDLVPIQTKTNKTGLPDQLKHGIENLSGIAMDDVRVHYNSSKPAQVHAHAFAQGSDIHMAPGQEKHLPHEAWHVVQQKQGRVKPTIQLAKDESHSVGSEGKELPVQRKLVGKNGKKLTLNILAEAYKDKNNDPALIKKVEALFEGHRNMVNALYFAYHSPYTYHFSTRGVPQMLSHYREARYALALQMLIHYYRSNPKLDPYSLDMSEVLESYKHFAQIEGFYESDLIEFLHKNRHSLIEHAEEVIDFSSHEEEDHEEASDDSDSEESHESVDEHDIDDMVIDDHTRPRGRMFKDGKELPIRPRGLKPSASLPKTKMEPFEIEEPKKPKKKQKSASKTSKQIVDKSSEEDKAVTKGMSTFEIEEPKREPTKKPAFTKKKEKYKNTANDVATYGNVAASKAGQAYDFLEKTSVFGLGAEITGSLGGGAKAIQDFRNAKSQKESLASGILTNKGALNAQASMEASNASAKNNLGFAISTLATKLGVIVPPLSIHAGNKMAHSGSQSLEHYTQNLLLLEVLLKDKGRSINYKQAADIIKKILAARVTAAKDTLKSGQATQRGGKVMLSGVFFPHVALAALLYTVGKTTSNAVNTYISNKSMKEAIGENARFGYYGGLLGPNNGYFGSNDEAYKKILLRLSEMLGEHGYLPQEERKELLFLLGLNEHADKEAVLKKLKL